MYFCAVTFTDVCPRAAETYERLTLLLSAQEASLLGPYRLYYGTDLGSIRQAKQIADSPASLIGVPSVYRLLIDAGEVH